LHKEGKLVGFILVGDVREGGILHYKLGKSLSAGYWGKIRAVEEDEILA
jgi:NAD(P)H-nitrite reductase large subunit